MAVYWLYETTSGDNICENQTVNVNVTATTPDGFQWTPADPNAPDGLDLQPWKQYNISTNTVSLANNNTVNNLTLRKLKLQRYDEFRKKTRHLLSRGQTISNLIFTLNDIDLLLYLDCQARVAVITYPYNFSSYSGEILTVNNITQMNNFLTSVLGRWRQIIIGEIDLRKLVKDAVNPNQVNAVQDTRV